MNIYEFAYTVPGDEHKPSVRLGGIRAVSKGEAIQLLEDNHPYIDVHVLRYWRTAHHDYDFPVNTGHQLFDREEKNPHA